MSPLDEQEVKRFALQQNITTLRNRVNALGVAEPIIQQQGDRRIVVQLPGAQDPGRLKELLGATATLEYRLVDTEHSVEDAVDGRVPVSSKLYEDRDGRPVLLLRRVIVTGDQITDASAGFDQRTSQPAVFVSLDGQGARRMRNVTTENVGKPMAVVFIENRTLSRMVGGEVVKRKVRTEEVISVANILEPFGRRFQTTGLDSSTEAHDLALLLRPAPSRRLSRLWKSAPSAPASDRTTSTRASSPWSSASFWWSSSWRCTTGCWSRGRLGAVRQPGHDRCGVVAASGHLDPARDRRDRAHGRYGG